MPIIHLSLVWRTLWTPGKVRHGWVIYHQFVTQGTVILRIWCVTMLTVVCVNVSHFTLVRHWHGTVSDRPSYPGLMICDRDFTQKIVQKSAIFCTMMECVIFKLYSYKHCLFYFIKAAIFQSKYLKVQWVSALPTYPQLATGSRCRIGHLCFDVFVQFFHSKLRPIQCHRIF